MEFELSSMTDRDVPPLDASRQDPGQDRVKARIQEDLHVLSNDSIPDQFLPESHPEAGPSQSTPRHVEPAPAYPGADRVDSSRQGTDAGLKESNPVAGDSRNPTRALQGPIPTNGDHNNPGVQPENPSGHAMSGHERNIQAQAQSSQPDSASTGPLNRDLPYVPPPNRGSSVNSVLERTRGDAPLPQQQAPDDQKTQKPSWNTIMEQKANGEIPRQAEVQRPIPTSQTAVAERPAAAPPASGWMAETPSGTGWTAAAGAPAERASSGVDAYGWPISNRMPADRGTAGQPNQGSPADGLRDEGAGSPGKASGSQKCCPGEIRRIRRFARQGPDLTI